MQAQPYLTHLKEMLSEDSANTPQSPSKPNTPMTLQRKRAVVLAASAIYANKQNKKEKNFETVPSSQNAKEVKSLSVSESCKKSETSAKDSSLKMSGNKKGRQTMKKQTKVEFPINYGEKLKIIKSFR